ncbi:MAG: DUF6152 family protein [Rhodospirillaceae bacterium]|nr:DUF6152 family protein [Rhodospirillaceae bacterium]MDE0000987.1 DUF6152 family protein [Rhodospirillaceae bacterium]
MNGNMEIRHVRIMGTLLALAGISAGSIVIGHHSDAGYDRDIVVAFEGVVTSYSFRNPHIAILVETENENGETIEWDIETGSTPIMIRSGWTADLLSEGETVAIRAHPERSGRLRAILNTMQTTDGQVWYQVEEDPVDTVAATSIDGVWRGLSTFSLRRGLNQVPLTPAAEAARAEYDYFTQTPVRDCVAPPPPSLLASTTYLNGIEVFEDRVILRNEYFDQTRIVYMDGREHPETGERTSWEGHSIGWWEGETLVVDTVQFRDHPEGNGRGVPSGAQKHMIERYSLSEDGRRVLIDVFLEDPEFLAEPFNGHTEMVYSPELELLRYECDPVLSRQGGFE